MCDDYPRAEEWKSADTAPKTNELILACDRVDGVIVIAYWEPSNERPIGYAPDAKFPGWFSQECTDQCGEKVNLWPFTDWMYLPRAPR